MSKWAYRYAKSTFWAHGEVAVRSRAIFGSGGTEYPCVPAHLKHCSQGISFSTEGNPKTDVIPLAGFERKSLFPSFQGASEIPRPCWQRARAKIRHYLHPQRSMSVTAMRLTDSIYEVWLDLFNLHGAKFPLFCIWCLWDGPFLSSFCCPVPVFQLKWRAPPRGQYFKSVTALNYRERNSSYSGNSFFFF